MNSSILRVPGARLYSKARGSGPVLLIIAGGGGDADSSDRFAEILQDHFSVVTYDRRGYARSPLDDPAETVQIQTHSEDVHHLLASVSVEPAYLLGSSIGALIGLDFAIRHPAQVRLLVAHEPPVTQLLSPGDPQAGQAAGLLRFYRQEGPAAAIQKFAASIGVERPSSTAMPAQPQQEEPAASSSGIARPAAPAASSSGIARLAAPASEANLAAFFQVDAPAVVRYTLDLAALRATPARILLAGGSAGRAYFPYVCAARLSDQTGLPFVEFPGSHSAFAGQPLEFATRLREVLK